MRIALVLAAACLLAAGCSSTGGSPAEESRSDFDGARRVQVAGHGGACSGLVCSGLGASWSSARPDRVLLTVHVFNETCAILGARVRVGAEVVDLGRPVGLATKFSRPGSVIRESVQTFDVPLGLVRRLANADSAWLRVGTSVGYVEDGLARSRAAAALARLLAVIEGGRL